MSFFKRLGQLVAARGDAVLDAAEVPAQTFDHAYNKMLDTLTDLRRAIVEVITARKQIEQQINGLTEQNGRIDQQARQALLQGNETLAQQALLKRPPLQAQIAALNGQRQQMVDKGSSLELAAQRLAARIQAFRSEKETLSATSTASAAQVKVSASLAGVGEEMGSINAAMERARMKIARQSARAAALDEVVGQIDFNTGMPIDPVQLQLDQASAQASIAGDLDRLKGQLGLPSSQPPIQLTSQPVPNAKGRTGEAS
ncbi:MAG: PspA/IM30 family protein [Proteobacteria bacterium]|nr:PspA/IM30 family protein [Pseudomonadota bacterium]OYV38651.1 MAG: hypothetical protein B7Z80_09430 [Rhodospirillales bacterium 20-64-7]HQT76253.1 PspA/IM30 family protein [Rhodopila sp.]